MKFNWGKSVVTAVTAGMLLSGLPGVALAENADTVTYNPDATAITKNWTVASADQLDLKQTFTFHMKYESYTPQGTTDDASAAIKAVDKDIVMDKLTANGTTSATGTETWGTVLNGLNFNEPGVYTFSLKENGGQDLNVKYDTDTTYYLVVNVEWVLDNAGAPTGNTQIQSVAIRKGENTENADKVDSATFNNTAADHGTLAVTKKVAGTAANTDEYFTFTINVKGISGTYTIAYSDGAQGNNPTSVTADENGDATVNVSLKHGQTATIANLPATATYTTTEAGNSYTTTVKDSDGYATLNNDERTASATVGQETDTVTYTNEKGFAPATGITANTLPFVGVAAVAVAGGIVLVVKRNRQAREDF